MSATATRGDGEPTGNGIETSMDVELAVGHRQKDEASMARGSKMRCPS
jgi:hypothetical protein